MYFLILMSFFLFFFVLLGGGQRHDLYVMYNFHFPLTLLELNSCNNNNKKFSIVNILNKNAEQQTDTKKVCW